VVAGAGCICGPRQPGASRHEGCDSGQGVGAASFMPTTGIAEMTGFFDKVLYDDPGATTRKSARKPWWLATASARHGLLMGTGYWVIAVAALIASFFTVPIVARMLAGLWLVFGAWFLASAAIVSRRVKEPETPSPSEQPPDLPPSS
jgi:hypothetical protein